jgi:hypothetical protein
VSRVILPLGEMPGTIRESVRAVLTAHGFTFADRVDGCGVVALADDRVERLLRELGNNVAQALYGIGVDPEDAPVGDA